MKVHLLDGTYELFRHYYGQQRRGGAQEPSELAATRGVVASVISMLAGGVSHLGVATDHIIESFRNELWPGYKTSAGVPEDLLAQFPVLEDALESLGVLVWPMVELEADDAMASAAAVTADDRAVDQVLICSPDKDLAQCVADGRVVQLDRRTGALFDEAGVRDRFGVGPTSIPDWLALSGDSADGYPGLKGWGRVTAAAVLSCYGHIDGIPDDAAAWEPSLRSAVRGAANLASRLASERELAMLFRNLATLRIDRSLLDGTEQLAWQGPAAGFDEMAGFLGDRSLAERAARIGAARR